MLEAVRLALRITDTDFDDEIQMLIDACLAELSDIGIITSGGDYSEDSQITMAVVMYCKAHFGQSPDADKWTALYGCLVGRLRNTAGYGLEED